MSIAVFVASRKINEIVRIRTQNLNIYHLPFEYFDRCVAKILNIYVMNFPRVFRVDVSSSQTHFNPFTGWANCTPFTRRPRV
jgi:hypothetical protein